MIEHLDARAKTWPRLARYPYLALRWFLIVLGVYLVIMLAHQELSEHRLGLGTGVVMMLILAVLKGLGIAVDQVTAKSQSGRTGSGRPAG